MSRQRKPKALKEQQGTLEKSREPENPVQAIAVKELHANGELINSYATQEWKQVTSGLAEMGILYSVSKSILLMYCNSIGLYFQSMDKVKKGGIVEKYSNGNLAQSPYIKIANDALEKALKISVKFGLTPADMDKLNSPTPPKEDDWIGK